jgi:NitT/TauT family transport system substrate-binding protein
MNRGKSARRGSLAAGAAVIALMLGACSSGGADSGKDGGESGPIPVTVGAVFTTATVPLWVGVEEGIFEKHGLEVTLTQSPNFAASVPALLNGQYQFANAATGPAITSIEKGVPIKIIAGVSAQKDDPGDGDDMVAVAADSDITRPRDLEGRTVATNAVGSGPYVGVMANYLADGGKADGVKWVVIPLNEQVAAVQSGKVDAAVLSEPFAAIGRQAGLDLAFNAYQVPGLDVFTGGFQDAVLVAAQSYIGSDEKVVKQMYDAVVEANDFAEHNPDVVRDLLVKYVELDPEAAKEVQLPAFVGPIDPAGVQSMADAMLKLGLITKAQSASDMVWAP